MNAPHTLVVRLDSAGDVLLSGPAVRAVSASSGRVTFLCSPAGAPAARMLPGVDEVLECRAPWIVADAPPVDPREIDRLVRRLAARRIDAAVILTSFHQSPLPTALVLRLAGVARIGAISVDYPGSLLDVRHHVDDGLHEVERGLSLTERMGFALPPGDDGRLAVRRPLPTLGAVESAAHMLAVHPGASVPARSWHPDKFRAVVALAAERGWRVVVTGSRHERGLTAHVAAGHPMAEDLGGRTTLPELAAVVARATVTLAGNTGPAHLAAAVGTPVVSIFAPTVPVSAWRPWGVLHRVLGDQTIGCALCRARLCPVAGHPCIDDLRPENVLAAIEDLAIRSRRRHARPPSENRLVPA